MSVFSNPLRILSKAKDRRTKSARVGHDLADLVRTPQLFEIDPRIFKPAKDSRPFDDYFTKLYVRYLEGKLLGVWTRVKIDSIVPGFLIRESDGSIKHVKEEATVERVVPLEYEIRRGFRPSLVLYRGAFEGWKDKFVCCDDLTAYGAYCRLAIKRVPAMVIGNAKELLTESAICTRVTGKNGEARFDSTIPRRPSAYDTILGDDEHFGACPLGDALARLVDASRLAAHNVSQFHVANSAKDSDVIHYHQTLHSIAFRMSEGIETMQLLFERGLVHQIRPVVRSLYELFLNFYLDWLCPEQIGPLLQSLAILSRSGKGSPEIKDLSNAIASTYRGLADICVNVSAKAQLSPLGKHFHDAAYPTLSQIVHQDFGVTHEYVSTLETGAPKPMDDDEVRLYVRWLDLIVSATVARITDDVGVYAVSAKAE